MLTLILPLKIEEKKGVAHLVLWPCGACGDHYSFRATLTHLEQDLSNAAPASHELPPEYEMEDFVTGNFRWGSRRFSLYYERSLGYMQFSSSSLTDVQALEAAFSAVTQLEKA